MKILEDKGYTYQKHLSTGGEGEVHLIKRVDKDFIAKIIPALDDASIDVLKTIQKLNIEGIPKIHDVFSYKDKTIIIRDYVEGTTLHDEIRKNEYLSLKRAKTIILKISEILRQLHNAKPKTIIYRDLKPENIIVTPEGNIQLIDFSIARCYKMESTRDTVLAGTKGYTAPEVMAGMQSDTRSDIYSVGLLFYEMLTGKNLLVPPFQIRPVKESNEYLPEWIDQIIERATDLNQTKRYKEIDEFVNAIEKPAFKKKRKIISKIKKKLLIGAVATIVIVGTVFTICYIANKEGAIQVINSILSIENSDDKYNILIDLEFDDDEDRSWVNYCSETGNVEFVNGQLLVFNGCNIDYIAKPGMFVHYKVKQDESGAVGIGPYRINGSVYFEGNYHNDNENRDYSTNMIYFDGIPFKNSGQFVDCIIYVTEDNSAIYAIDIDEESNKICYISYQVPDILKDLPLYMEVNNCTDGLNVMVVESVKVVNGSIKKYLDDNFETYSIHQDMIDHFLEKDIESLDEITFKPVDEWN